MVFRRNALFKFSERSYAIEKAITIPKCKPTVLIDFNEKTKYKCFVNLFHVRLNELTKSIF